MIVPLLAPLAAITAAFGLIFGSFFNVVIWRVPRQESIVSPPSACPNCSTPIRPRDNIPVISWLLLRGKCRDCAAPISAQYPAVELITGVAFALVALMFVPAVLVAGNDSGFAARILEFIAFIVLAASSVVLAGIDISVHRLPNAIVAPTFVAGAVLLTGAALVGGDLGALLRAGIAGAAAFLFYFAIAFIRPDGMGIGDVKLAGVLGMYLGFLGWEQFAVGIAAGFVLGGVFGLILLGLKRAKRGSGIPFGPWMLAGAWIGVAFGEPLANVYLTSVGLR
ncbi:A24 family peptidase [soil metagenome]